jgi:uncharacterized protein YprB with RNaseH-like and TPR domain
MIPEELRRKLEELLSEAPRAGAHGPDAPSTGRPLEQEKPAGLEDLIAGEIVGGPEKPFYLIRRPLERLFPRADEFTREFLAVWKKGRHALSREELAGEWGAIIRTEPTRLLFLDIETLGLASTPIFLVGTMRLDAEGRFRLSQLFARDYSEEVNILAHAAGLIADCGSLVTYNGKSFDWPYIRDRSLFHSVEAAGEPEHLDLLHEARRRWKTILPNCQLQTVEYHVSRRRRVGDIPGNMVPDAYHRYVKTRDARRMLDVIHHNALDLVTMAEMMLFILQGGELEWD